MFQLASLQSRYNLDISTIFFSRVFLAVLLLKIVAGTIFASDYMTGGFIPFVNYFVNSGFQDPYAYFASLEQTAAFPYPPLMLVILGAARLIASPFLTASTFVISYGHQFVAHLPIILADIFIYLLLCKWLETKEKKVLWYYWCSPVLFYISYFHGQLDVIPMAFLFASLSYLFNKKIGLAMIILGLSFAIKTHLLVVLPFYAIYLWVNRYSLSKILIGCFLSLAIFGLATAPAWYSPGFWQSILASEEAGKVFLVNVSYIHNNLRLFLAPLVVLLLFLNFYHYKKLNKDAFLLILALVFTTFVVFVPPMPGWFFWPIPFFAYYFAKYRDTPRLSFWLLNAVYILYVIFSSDSHFFSSFRLISPTIMSLNSPFELLSQQGINVSLSLDLIFTALVATTIMNAVWIYRTGVRSNLEYRIADKPLIIGIGGDSGAGKTMLAELLRKTFGSDKAINLEGDDAHKWERGDLNWQKITHLDPKGNRLHSELLQAQAFRQGRAIHRKIYDHDTGRFTAPNYIEPGKVVVYVGLHPFYLSQMRQMFDIKIFVEPDEALRQHWKVERDSAKRGKTKAEVLQQLKAREADARKYIRPQRNFADIVISFVLKEKIRAGRAPQVNLRLTCNNSLAVDALLESLARYKTLHAEHWYQDDLEHQTVEFSGTLAPQQINEVARTLLPNLDELIQVGTNWEANYNGLCQLFIAYFASELQKNRDQT